MNLTQAEVRRILDALDRIEHKLDRIIAAGRWPRCGVISDVGTCVLDKGHPPPHDYRPRRPKS